MMKLLYCALLITLSPLSLCATKFVLVGSLGDLAKKYLWAAISENVSKLDSAITIYGASRGSAAEGRLALNNILGTLPQHTHPLDGLEEKFASLLHAFPGGEDLLSQSQRSFFGLFDQLGVTGSSLYEKLNTLFERVPKTSTEVKSDLDEIFRALSSSSENFLKESPGKFSELAAGVSQFVAKFSETSSKSSERIMSEMSVFLRNSQKHISGLADKMKQLNFNSRPFKDRVKYLQLKSASDYEAFCEKVANDHLIFYLSIPPSAYTSTTGLISKFCRKNGNKISVAYEKPFGYDFKSSEELFSSLDRLIGKQNIFLIDHYIGKSISQQIISVRKANPALESILNKNHVSSIRVSLLEEADCLGRVGYYDKSGVFRDMLQNHATELLALVMADLRSDFSSAKIELLNSLTKPSKHQTVVAQYDGYVEHVGHSTSTPTFASVLFSSSLQRWLGVPIILTSGKSQHSDQKSVIVTFTDGNQLIFDYISSTVTYRGQSLLPASFTVIQNSYTPLIMNIITGNREILPDAPSVLASWRIWDDVISLPHNTLVHEAHKDLHVELHGRFLIASNTVHGEEDDSETGMKFFNKALLVSDHEEHLYEHIVLDMIRVINMKGDDETVHLALSGGSTVLGVYKYLLSNRDKVDWVNVHIWQIDERCDWKHTNAANLHYYLLDSIDVSPDNVHLMPVNRDGCGDVAKYQDEFDSVISGKRFDYVLLGLGTDGHTASLFSNGDVLSTSADFSIVRVENVVSPHRMTVTFDQINRADWVSILVTGVEKRDIIQSLRNGDHYPVSHVSNEHLTWYIDEVLL